MMTQKVHPLELLMRHAHSYLSIDCTFI